jgi:hypothetical protein
MDEFSDPSPVATVEAYMSALKAVRDQYGRERPFSASKELEMLRVHYEAPQHTITTTQLAELVGFSSYSTANMQYGKLACRIANELNYRPGPFISTKDPHWWRTLAYGNDGAALTSDGRYEWIMRPELALALEGLGWHRRRRPSQ